MIERQRGETPLSGGNKVIWTREDGSPEEVSVIRDRAAAVTYRVRTLQPRPDGAGTLTTYSVPGAQLDTWLHE